MERNLLMAYLVVASCASSRGLKSCTLVICGYVFMVCSGMPSPSPPFVSSEKDTTVRSLLRRDMLLTLLVCSDFFINPRAFSIMILKGLRRFARDSLLNNPLVGFMSVCLFSLSALTCDWLMVSETACSDWSFLGWGVVDTSLLLLFRGWFGGCSWLVLFESLVLSYDDHEDSDWLLLQKASSSRISSILSVMLNLRTRVL